MSSGQKKAYLGRYYGATDYGGGSAANCSDREGTKLLMQRVKQAQLPNFCRIWVDAGEEFMRWVFDTYRWMLEVTARSGKGFAVATNRWVVERTWFNRWRRLSKDSLKSLRLLSMSVCSSYAQKISLILHS